MARLLFTWKFIFCIQEYKGGSKCCSCTSCFICNANSKWIVCQNGICQLSFNTLELYDLRFKNNFYYFIFKLYKQLFRSNSHPGLYSANWYVDEVLILHPYFGALSISRAYSWEGSWNGKMAVNGLTFIKCSSN